MSSEKSTIDAVKTTANKPNFSFGKKATNVKEDNNTETADLDHPAPVSKTANFVYVDDARRALALGFATGENLVLFGKGGFAKSELSEDFFESKGIVPFVKTMGSGTTTDSLFGGIDIKTFNDTGKIEFLVENSFMNHEYVVFEELFDAPDFILEQLKDILTSKQFRNGTQIFPIKTKYIVSCTNKTREEFAKNDSLKALLERFPLECKVEWPGYTRTQYDFMFQKMFGKKFNELSYIMEKLHQAGTTISPRTAVKAARILEQSHGDTSVLDFIADFSGKNKNLVQGELTKFKNIAVIENSIDNINKMMSEARALSLNSLESIKLAKTLIRSIDEETKKLKSKKVDDEVVKNVNAAVKSYEEFIKELSKKITDVTE